MKLIRLINIKIETIKINIRRYRYFYFFRSLSVIILSNVTFRFKPNSIVLGKHFTILNNSVLEFNDTSNVKIGNYCQLSYGVVLAVKGNFVMGNFVMIGEYTSIRDYTHDYSEVNKPMALSNNIINPIVIGNNVWIGRGCIILPGTIIEDGVVVGANSVVKGILKEESIYAGVPAKFIKKRI